MNLEETLCLTMEDNSQSNPNLGTARNSFVWSPLNIEITNNASKCPGAGNHLLQNSSALVPMRQWYPLSL